MKLQTRLTFLVTVIIVIVSTSFGLFALQINQSTQIQRLDDRLNLATSELSKSTEDPLSVATLLSDESDLKFSVAYVSEERDLITIYESSANLSKLPEEKDLIQSQVKPITLNQSGGVRIRTLKLPDNQFLILSISTMDISKSSREMIRDLFLFTILLILLSFLSSNLLFKRDNQLNMMVKTLRQNQERIKSFVADASHELRTPLTVIKGYFDLIGKLSLNNLTPPSGYLDRIDTEIQRMEKMVSDLLLLAELDQADIKDFDKVNLSLLLNQKITDFANFYPQRKISKNIKSNIFMNCHRDYLEQLIGNIVSNIARYTPPDSEVEVRLLHEGSKICLTFEDSGPGLPEYIYRDGIQIFQRFDKSRSRESGGSGLGMTIIRKVTESLGGEISLGKSKFGGLKIEIWI